MTVVECPSLLATYPFYSVILGFLGYHWFPLFAPSRYQNQCCATTTLMANPFLIPHSSFLIIFFFLGFLLQKPLADFPVLGDPRRLTFVFSFSKALGSIFSDPPFGFFLFVIFPKWANSFLPGWKFPSHLPSWFSFLCSPRYQPLVHELLVSKPSDPFSTSLGGW